MAPAAALRLLLAAAGACCADATPAAIAFAQVFGDSMVLQRMPEKAAVFGTLAGDGAADAAVTVEVAGAGKTYSVEAEVQGSSWKALLQPTSPGGDWTVTVTSGAASAQLLHVTFGDVWYCAGQSNMALPLLHTMSRNKSLDAVRAGKYDNLRIHGMSGNMNPTQPWATPKAAAATCPDAKCPFFSFSSTCWYFGESLADELGPDAPPIGLIHTAWGGSTIEQWLNNKTIAQCRNATLDKSNQEWHDQRVLPYVDMTIKGWTWYQGENDMHGTHGNSKLGYGYGCLMPALVSSWRSLWSSTPGTTDPLAPFGFVTLAPSGSEGGRSMGAMRWAQTANYGVAPNAAMPNTFLAQAFDLNDPYSNITCYSKGCCGTDPKGPCGGCDGYCASTSATNFYMGPIHPRDKKPVGQRLARAGAVLAYGKPGLLTGPTLAGCSMAGGKIVLKFNSSLLGQDHVSVQAYSKDFNMSRVQVLTNRSLFCLQTGGRGTECVDDGTGRDIGQGPFDDTKRTWVSVDVEASGKDTLVVDLAKSGGVAFAIRYAWDGDCCEGAAPTSEPCPIASCPIMAAESRLPANPFLAKITQGRCRCLAPQVCDEEVWHHPSVIVA